jgi:uracil phosphoribosyltransferase
MSNKVVLKAEDLDGYLTDTDKKYLSEMDACYKRVMSCLGILSTTL